MKRQMKATTVLMQQQQAVRTLLDELSRADDANDLDAKTTVRSLSEHLIAHIVAEQEVLYPPLFLSAADAVRQVASGLLREMVQGRGPRCR